jgi:IS30 family transposase
MYKHLTQHELYYIWYHCVQDFIKLKVSDVANKLGKHRSTVYRAIAHIKQTNWRPDSGVTPGVKMPTCRFKSAHLSN